MMPLAGGLGRLLRPWRALSLVPLMVAGGCSSADVVNALVPRDNVIITRDERYGDQPRQSLDIYRPIDRRARLPIVIFFYGGEWQSGSKDMYLFVGQALAERGIVAVIPDYRLFPDVRFPEFLEDGAEAVRWTIDHAGDLGGDSRRVYLMGHSAGAYITAMLTLDRRWLSSERAGTSRSVRGAIGLAGPYDFLPLRSSALRTIFGPEDRLQATQPINFVSGGEPPMLLITGDADDVVDPANSARLAARIRAKGGTVEERRYRSLGHVRLVGSLARPLQFLAPTMDDVVSFIASHD